LVTDKESAHFHGCQIATTNSVKQHKLKKLIAWLSEKEGTGKEFVSLYVPRGKPIDQVIAVLKAESDSVAAKSKRLDYLQDALKNVNQRLKMLKEIPENGLAVFAGTFAANDSDNSALNVEEVIPPEPITQYYYAVDNHFLLEPLREMLRDLKVVGLLVLDSKEASFGLLNGERFESLENITSGIHGKSGKGGSSQRRYERERDTELTHYFHRIAEHAAKAFLENSKVNALLVGGPGTTKEDFLNGDFLHYELKNVFLGKVDTQSASKEGVKEVLDKSSETLSHMCLPEQKRTITRLMASIAKQDGLATYGLDSVFNALKMGEVETALVTDNTDMIEIVSTCKRCEFPKSKIVENEQRVQTIKEMISIPCERCGAVDYEINEKDIIAVLEDLASKTDSLVEVVASESQEKARLAVLSGFAALLRYKHR
jgi:peptide chain release factor subunit 1